MIPKEYIEQQILANRLDFNKYTFSAIRNESDTHSFYKWKQRKLSWVRSWIPDFFIILKRNSLLLIELKRQIKVLKNWKLWASPSVISQEQLQWKDKLNNIDNIQCDICFWANEAINLINKLENE